MPQYVATQPAPISARAQSVRNTGALFVVGIPLLSQGADVKGVLILEASLDSAVATELALPWYMGDLTAGRDAPFALIFPLRGMMPGEKHTIQIRGVVGKGTDTHPFYSGNGRRYH